MIFLSYLLTSTDSLKSGKTLLFFATYSCIKILIIEINKLLPQPKIQLIKKNPNQKKIINFGLDFLSLVGMKRVP